MAEEVVSMEQPTSAREAPKATKAVKKAGSRESGGLKKGPWTPAEDAILMEHVRQHGEGNWNRVQRHSGLKRCGKSCRLRWANHLRPNLKKGSFSPEEEELILRLHAQLGNKWARMAVQLPGRTDNEIKNFWNTRLKRRQRVGLPIYPPKIQDTVGSESHSQPQHHASTSSGMPPLPLSTRSWPKFNSLQLPSPFYPANPCPPSRITLPPIPWSPFPCHLDFGFTLKSISPPSTPTPLLQKHLVGTQSYNMAPLVPPPTQITMELPSFQMYPKGGGGGSLGGGGNISGQSSCMLMEALLQDTHVADDINIGELLGPPDVDEHVAGWEELVYGGDLTGCSGDGSKLPTAKIEGLDGGTGSTINGEGVGDGCITEDTNIPALLEMPASAAPMITDWYNVGSTGVSNIAQSSAIQANDDLGFELQQLASAFSHDPSDQQDWNINALAPWDTPGIC